MCCICLPQQATSSTTSTMAICVLLTMTPPELAWGLAHYKCSIIICWISEQKKNINSLIKNFDKTYFPTPNIFRDYWVAEPLDWTFNSSKLLGLPLNSPQVQKGNVRQTHAIFFFACGFFVFCFCFCFFLFFFLAWQRNSSLYLPLTKKIPWKASLNSVFPLVPISCIKNSLIICQGG